MNDLISRQALCEYALNQKDKSITPNEIMRFPSTYPKKGKWIPRIGLKYPDLFTCSECTEQFDYKWNYCPNCGADMRGESDD